MAQPCCEVPCTLYLAPVILRSLLVTARASCLHTRSRWALCLCQTLERRKESFITALPERLPETAGLKWKAPVNSFLLLRVGNHQSCSRLRFLDNYWRHRGTSIDQNALPSVWASPGLGVAAGTTLVPGDTCQVGGAACSNLCLALELL